MSQQQAIDYYFNILGLPPTASFDDVVKARRFFAQVLHPDIVGRNPNLKDWANERMAAINGAHDKLRDWFDAGCPQQAASSTSSTSKSSGPDLSEAPDWTVWEEERRQDWTESVKAWEEEQRQRNVYVRLQQEKQHRIKTLNLAKNALQGFVVVLWVGIGGCNIVRGCEAQMTQQVLPPEGQGVLVLCLTILAWWLLNSEESKRYQSEWIETGTVSEIEAAAAKAAKIAAEKAMEYKAAAEKFAIEKAAELKEAIDKAAAEKKAAAKTATDKETESQPQTENETTTGPVKDEFVSTKDILNSFGEKSDTTQEPPKPEPSKDDNSTSTPDVEIEIVAGSSTKRFVLTLLLSNKNPWNSPITQTKLVREKIENQILKAYAANPVSESQSMTASETKYEITLSGANLDKQRTDIALACEIVASELQCQAKCEMKEID